MKIKLPGLIDIHTHMRTPGQTHKEDFFSGTRAALHGGFTTVIDMPNNLIPITTQELLTEKINIAQNEVVVDTGFHFGSLGNNLEQFSRVERQVFGLKLYLNQTTGGFIIGKKELERIYKNWNNNQPILLHAEEDVLELVFEIVKVTKKKTHICHISSKKELYLIMRAKENGLPVTCGVTPHHLFLNKSDEKKLGAFGKMKPYLKSKIDVDFLWENLEYIDLIESDHAPHTILEKKQEAPFGVPGLETTLPLLLSEVGSRKITTNKIIELCSTNPAKIFNIEVDNTTYVEVILDEFTLTKDMLLTKSGWSPFEGKTLVGIVDKVVMHGKTLLENGKIIAKKGSGKIIFPRIN